MELICFTSSKGGVGTSHLVGKISSAASKMGYKCLCVDLHSKRRTLDIYLDVTDSFVYDINDVLGNTCTFEDALVKADDNIFFLPCSQSKDICDYSKVYNVLKESAVNFDFVFVDAPFDKCDADSKVVLVTTCDSASLRCTEKLCWDLQNSQKYLIINKIDVDLIVNEINPNVDDICDMCAVPPIGLVPYNREYFNQNTPNEMCDMVFQNIVKRLNNIPALAVEFNSKKSKKIFGRR